MNKNRLYTCLYKCTLTCSVTDWFIRFNFLSIGIDANGGNAYLSCHANYVCLQTTPWPVRIQWTCINLPHDVASFASSLPRQPSQLDVIIVRKEGANNSHRDFRVRRSVVHQALQWLVTHNMYYRALGVRIDNDTLDQLPPDGNLSHLVSVPEASSSLETTTAGHISSCPAHQ